MGRITAAIVALPLAACVGQGGIGHSDVVAEEADDYRVSVEIPLDELGAYDGADGRILKVDELLDERTDFDADDFALDEVVLVARSASGHGGDAELLVLEWRSGLFAVPEGGEDDWFEVRIPAPEEDLGGAWLLDLTGAVTVDMLVAVLEPKPRVVEASRVVTTHRTRTIYRDIYPATHYVHWLYDPARYYIYHDYGGWPYRYFIGPWDYRYYDLTYRPYRYHYGPIYRSRYRERGGARGYRGGREFSTGERSERGAATAAERRRISPELVKLRRNHPRLRTLRQRPAAGAEPQATAARNEPARARGTARRTDVATRRAHVAGQDAAERPHRRAAVRDQRATTRATREHRSAARVGELRRSHPERRAAATSPNVASPQREFSRREYSRPDLSRREQSSQAPAKRAQTPRLSRDASAVRPNSRQRAFERPAHRESAPVRAAAPAPRNAGKAQESSARATAPNPRRVYTRPAPRDLPRQVQRRSSVQPRAVERPRPVRRAAEPASAQRPAARTETRRAVRQEPRPSAAPRSERAPAPRTGTATAESRRPVFERR